MIKEDCSQLITVKSNERTSYLQLTNPQTKTEIKETDDNILMSVNIVYDKIENIAIEYYEIERYAIKLPNNKWESVSGEIFSGLEEAKEHYTDFIDVFGKENLRIVKVVKTTIGED